jgi:hypothetical protein
MKGSGKPKSLRILRIQIWNTGFSLANLKINKKTDWTREKAENGQTAVDKEWQRT